MFGYLRFVLAYLVLLSHIQIAFYTLNIGVFSVVMFYILAGYVVSNLYLNILPNTKYKTFEFYKDRIKRIFPLYLYTLIISFVFILYTQYGEPKYSLQNIISNLTIIPLNYYMYLDSTILQNPNWALIPPAWSLGAELQAYILLSLIFIYRKLKYIFAILTLIIYTLANFSYLHPDYYGYRFIVGVFFIFLIGSSIQKIKSKKCEDNFDKYFPIFAWLYAVILYIIFTINNSFSPTYTKETLLGLIIGIPLIFIISKQKIRLKYNTILGQLSYGVFLSHFLAIWILDFYNITKENNFYILYVSAISFFIAYIGVRLFENKKHTKTAPKAL